MNNIFNIYSISVYILGKNIDSKGKIEQFLTGSSYKQQCIDSKNTYCTTFYRFGNSFL